MMAQQAVSAVRCFLSPHSFLQPHLSLISTSCCDSSPKTLNPTAGADDAAGFQMLAALAAAFHALQPLRVPGFAFSWLELISHR